MDSNSFNCSGSTGTLSEDMKSTTVSLTSIIETTSEFDTSFLGKVVKLFC